MSARALDRRQSRRPPAGFSMVELMVAMALAMVVFAVLGRVWANSRLTFHVQDNNARMQENARFALQILERELRQAGYKGLNQESAEATLLFPSSGPQPLAGTNDTTSTVNGLTTDAFSVAFYGSGIGTNGDGEISNCFGIGVPASTLVQDTFTVKVDSVTGLPALMCTSTLSSGPTTATPIAYSVETLQVLYGEETDGLGQSIPNRLVQASVANMANVVQVRLSLLVRGEDHTVAKLPGVSTATRAVSSATPYGPTFYHFGTLSTSASLSTTAVDSTDSGAVSNLSTVYDGRQRALYGTTVALRNRTN